MAVYQSLKAYSKKNIEFELQKNDFSPEKIKATNTVIEWSFN